MKIMDVTMLRIAEVRSLYAGAGALSSHKVWLPEVRAGLSDA